MIPYLQSLIQALRLELQEYGEMLARLDRQQDSIGRRDTDDILGGVAAIQAQAGVIQQARREREEKQKAVAAWLQVPKHTLLAHLVERTPADYRPLLRALVDENNELLAQVHRRARRNHLLLRRSVALMRELVQSSLPGRTGAEGNEAEPSRKRRLIVSGICEVSD